MIRSLTLLSIKRPWITIIFWIVFIGLSVFVISRFLTSALTNDQSVTTEPESVKAEQLLADRLGSEEKLTEIVIVKGEEAKFSEASFRDFTTELEGKIKGLGGEVVESTVSFYSTDNPVFISKEEDAILLIVTLAGDLETAQENVTKVVELVRQADQDPSFSVYEAGIASINNDFNELAEKDLQKAEIFGLPIALIVLILVFGAVGAAVLPLALSILAIISALALSALIGQVYQLSFFVTNMITMMGLAVGIDYALFIISRFREEKAKGQDSLASIVSTSETAGRAIFFSGLTVILALSGLLIVPINVFRSLSLGAIFVVGMAVLLALSLLPALLAVAGNKINFLRIPFLGAKNGEVATQAGFWARTTKLVMSHPLISVEVSAGFLILCATPLLAIKIGTADVASLPDELGSKKAFLSLEEEFSSGLLSPTKIVVDADQASAQTKEALEVLSEKLRSEPIVAVVQPQIYPESNLAVLDVAISANGSKEAKIIEKIRNEYIPDAFGDSQARVLVGGQAASNLDFVQLIRRYNPIVFAFVLSLSFILLMLVFRSIVIALKAIIMNLLSTAAAYGLLVLVSVKGFGNEVLGFDQVPIVEAWIPLFLFAILFGLSMDYHVFLLSRIKEKYDETKNNTESVAFGISSTARIITGAALIMVAVFSAFAAGSLTMFQQFGFGLAIAILLDATVVRTILVPASMQLLGSANWYFPSWLEWIPNFSIERPRVERSKENPPAEPSELI